MTKTIKEALSEQDIINALGNQHHIYIKIINKSGFSNKPFNEVNWNKVSKLINDYLWKQVNSPSPPPTPILARHHTARGLRKKQTHKSKTRKSKTRKSTMRKTKTSKYRK